MEVSEKAKLTRLKDVKIRLCNPVGQLIGVRLNGVQLNDFIERRKNIDYVVNRFTIDSALEIFEWMDDNGITSNILFNDILNGLCDGDLDKLASVLATTLRKLHDANGVVLSIWGSNPYKLIEYVCKNIDSNKFKTDEQLMQELINSL